MSDDELVEVHNRRVFLPTNREQVIHTFTELLAGIEQHAYDQKLHLFWSSLQISQEPFEVDDRTLTEAVTAQEYYTYSELTVKMLATGEH